jgi:hypothetical protein
MYRRICRSRQAAPGRKCALNVPSLSANSSVWEKSNWIPTSAKGKFEVIFRFYGSEKPLFDKTWVLPDIEKAM